MDIKHMFNCYDAITLLEHIDMYGAEIPVLNRVIGLHTVIHDSEGASVVCEMEDSRKINIYYTQGIVTNGPNYPTQLTILEKYR